MSTNRTNPRKPYTGDRKALVIAFDVGTTFSGVSYAILEPGEVPKTLGVTRYPGQEHVTGNTKIPSLLYYDRSGKLRAAGAEAESAQVEAEAEEEGWSKVELFKLRLRPKTMHLETNGINFSPLPPGKSSEHVFGDFLHYLFVCTRRFIEDSHAAGDRLWRHVENNIHVVLSHPNGWEGPQQSRMRRAAIYAGLIPDTDEGKSRIRFVTEGEASMHACIHNGLAHDVLQSGNGFIVADAGGGTLDVSSYILRGMHPLTLEEVAPPDCIFAGAVFVSRRCRVFLQEKLRNSRYGTDDALDHITKRFDETTKRLFRDKNETQYIHFGSPLDKDLKVGIRNGQLKLTGEEVASFFEPSIEAAISSIKKQMESSRGVVKAVWLVGGFAASPWLYSQMLERLAPLGVTVNRPDTQTSKAVADGAIGFFCDHHVSARMSRYMYGVEYLREINNDDEEHRARQGRLLQLPSGPRFLPDAFDCILAKGVRVKESSVFSRKYYTEVTKLSTLSVFEIEIWCYRGGMEVPQWIDRRSDHFASLCFVRADLSKLSNSAQPKTGPNGLTYWTVVFSIEIHFGLTEFKARMKWNEDGKTRYGPASIVFNEKGVRSDEDDTYSIPDDELVSPVAPSLSSRQTSTSTTTTKTSATIKATPSASASVPASSPSVSKTPSMNSNVTSTGTVTGRPSSAINRTKSRGLANNAGHTPPASSFPSSTVPSSVPPSRTPSMSSVNRPPAHVPSFTPSTTSIRSERRAPEPAPPAPVVEPVAPSPSETLLNASTSRKSRPNSRLMTSFGKASPIQEAPPPPSPKREEPPLPPVVEEVKAAEARAPSPAPVEVTPVDVPVPAPIVEAVAFEPAPAHAPAFETFASADPPARSFWDTQVTATPSVDHHVEEVPALKEEAPAPVVPEPTPELRDEPRTESLFTGGGNFNFMDNGFGAMNPPTHTSDLLTETYGEHRNSSAMSFGGIPRSPTRSIVGLQKSPTRSIADLPKSPARSIVGLPRSPARSIVGLPRSPARSAVELPKSPARSFAEAPRSPAMSFVNHMQTPAAQSSIPIDVPRSPVKGLWETSKGSWGDSKGSWGDSKDIWENQHPSNTQYDGQEDNLHAFSEVHKSPKSPAKAPEELPKSPAHLPAELPAKSVEEVPSTLADAAVHKEGAQDTPAQDLDGDGGAATGPDQLNEAREETVDDFGFGFGATAKGKKGKKGKKGGNAGWLENEPTPEPPSAAKDVAEAPVDATGEKELEENAELEDGVGGDVAGGAEQPNTTTEETGHDFGFGMAAKGKKGKKGKKGGKANWDDEPTPEPSATKDADQIPADATGEKEFDLEAELAELVGGAGGDDAGGADQPISMFEQTAKGKKAKKGKKGKGNVIEEEPTPDPPAPAADVPPTTEDAAGEEEIDLEAELAALMDGDGDGEAATGPDQTTEQSGGKNKKGKKNKKGGKGEEEPAAPEANATPNKEDEDDNKGGGGGGKNKKGKKKGKK